MSKQTILLFVKALIIGVILNAGIQYFSEPAAPAQSVQSVQEIQQPAANSQADVDR